MGIMYYFICFALSFANLILFISTKKRYMSAIYVIIYLLLAICSSSYILLVLSKTIEEAFLAVKVVYLGAIFIPPVMLLLVCRFIDYKYYPVVCGVTSVFALVFLGFVSSIGFTDAYYVSSTAVLGKENGLSYIIKDTGPLYLYSKIYSAGISLALVGFLIYAFTKLKTVSYKSLFYLVALLVVTNVFSLISKKFSNTIDLMPAAYVISGFILYLLARKTNVYNLKYVQSVNSDNKDLYGYAGFDVKGRFVGANAFAKSVFPEFNDCKIDCQLPDADLFNDIRKLMDSFNDPDVPNELHRKVNDKTYKLVLGKNKISRRWDYGYFLEITDDTKVIEYLDLLNNYSEELEKEVNEKTAHIRLIQNKVLLGMANMVESRDELTGGHIKRTSDVVNILIQYIKINNPYDKSDEFYEYVRRAAPMHDLGKISVPDAILNKPGKFTKEEYEIMKTHSANGEKMVEVVLDGIENDEFLAITKNVARFHHEKYDGTGYPDKLIGDKIPVEARIMAVADVYDALVSKRVYKERLPFEDAANIIRDSMGSHFDPRLLEVFDACRSDLEEYYSKED